MKNENKALIFLIGGLILLEIGTALLTPSWWIVGIIIGVIGIISFVFGAYKAIQWFIKKKWE